MFIRFHPAAEIEFVAAKEWYQRQRKGLDKEFGLSIDEAIERILQFPTSYPIAYKHTRKITVRRFPYNIFYEVLENEIRVLAIYHSKRNPLKWTSRIKTIA